VFLAASPFLKKIKTLTVIFIKLTTLNQQILASVLVSPT
jgi:hypothetical protein